MFILNNIYSNIFFSKGFKVEYIGQFVREDELTIMSSEYGPITFTITCFNLSRELCNKILKIKSLENIDIKASRDRSFIDKALREGGRPCVGFFIDKHTDMYACLTQHIQILIRKYANAF